MTAPDDRPPPAGGLTVDDRAPPAVMPAGRHGLTRPPLPVTRRLDTRAIIAVDVDERMDEAAAIEAAAPAREGIWRKAVRVVLVALTGIAAWSLLPKAPAARPPIGLPAAAQADDVPLSKERRAHEAAAIAAFRDTGPHAAVEPLQACIDSGTASHSLWATFFTVLQRLEHDDELLARARQYAARHPDRLEGAHFLADALVRQPLAAHRVRDGFVGSKVSDEFQADLAAAQDRVEQALALVKQHARDWPHRTCTAWEDCLRVDAARLYEKRWLCRDAAFRDPFRDLALAELDALPTRDAADAVRLRLDIYRRLAASWPGVFAYTDKEPIGSHAHTHESLMVQIATLEERLADAPDGE